jgi:predicted GNAT family N-acyltransferase
MKQIFHKITPEMSALRENVFVYEQGVSMEDEHSDDESLFVHCCQFCNDKLVAYCRLKNENGVAHIGRVAVDKSFRSQGFGASIMLYAEDYAKTLNCTQAYINAMLYAKGFYSKLGYVPDGEEFDDAGIKHIRMTKNL